MNTSVTAGAILLMLAVIGIYMMYSLYYIRKIRKENSKLNEQLTGFRQELENIRERTDIHTWTPCGCLSLPNKCNEKMWVLTAHFVRSHVIGYHLYSRNCPNLDRVRYSDECEISDSFSGGDYLMVEDYLPR
jgi:hypothetical protein